MLRIALCEDEPHQIKQLSGMVRKDLKERGIAAAIDLYPDGEKLLISDSVYNIVLTDIEMGYTKGIDVAKRLFSKDRRIAFIFITSYKDYAIASYDVQAVHYIVKPAKQADISEGISRALLRIGFEDNGGLIVRQGSARRTILFRDIQGCEVVNHTVYLHLENESVQYYGKLDELEPRLDDRFYRCHRSAIANLSAITHLEEDTVQLASGVKLPLSRRKRQEVTDKVLGRLRTEGLL